MFSFRKRRRSGAQICQAATFWQVLTLKTRLTIFMIPVAKWSDGTVDSKVGY